MCVCGGGVSRGDAEARRGNRKRIRQWTDSSCGELDSQGFPGRFFYTTDYTDSTDGGKGGDLTQ